MSFLGKPPLKNKKKELIVFSLLAIISLSAILYYTYMIHSPVLPSDFPTVNIITEGDIKKDDYINCKIEVDDKESSDPIELLNSKIKIRGKYNAELPKKGYRIELSEEKSLLGMRKDDDWLLLAMYSDLSNLQIKLAFDLYHMLKPRNPTAILPDSEYVCVYVNGEFQGLYLLMEKNDRRLFGLDDAQNSINSSLIFQSSYFHNNFISYINDEWEQDWPNEYDGIYIMDKIMMDLVSFVRDTSNEEFFDSESGVYSVFDKQNLIDFYVYNFFILHDDFWDHNYFIIRNTYPSKFTLVPWDFDRCFGLWLSKSGSPERNDEEFIQNNNYLFFRLLSNEDFRTEMKARWFQLREQLWTEEYILDLVSENYEEIREILRIDAAKWYPWLFGDDWEERLDEAIDWLYNWIPERILFCDMYFSCL
ncbi:MAG: CotH kinase family protein [Candidatus Hermodarchaeota archaeon]